MADLTVRIIGDTTHLRGALRQGEGALGKFGSKLSGIGAIATGVFGGNLLTSGLYALKRGLGDVITAARDSERIGRLTEQVIKSTGGVANVSAGQVGTLAEKLGNLAGVDDEIVQGAANLLLTFSNVRDEVGKNNDIFSQATTAALDMSTALGTDANSAAIQLGKALNDPIRGITALSRAGVSFTKQQKEQIKTLVEQGDLLGAQKIILKEVGTEFGGAARAASDPMQRLSVVIENLKEKIGIALLPIIAKASEWLGERLPGALDKAGRFLREVFEGGKRLITDLADAFGTSEGTILKVLGAITLGLIGLAVAWNAGPGIIITGLVALVAGFLYAYENIEGFRKGVQGTLKVVSEIIKGFVDFAIEVWRRFGDDITSFAKNAWASVSQIVEGALEIIRGIIKVFTSLIHGDFSGAWEGIKEIFAGIWDSIIGRLKLAIDIVRLVLASGWELIRGQTIQVWEGIVDYFKHIPERLANFFLELPGRIRDVLEGVKDALIDLGKQIIKWIIEGITKAPGLADSITKKIPGFGGGAPFKDAPGIGRIIPGAHGLVVSKPTLALIGEDARTTPEIVTPEGLLRQIVREEGGRTNGNGTVTEVIQLVVDGAVLAQALRQYDRWNSGRN